MNLPRASKWGPAPINFTLTSSNPREPPRKLRLSDAPIKIGRASKTETRGALASSINALFECPVISREHAEFAFDHKQEQVTITDRDSMHGTFVNGRHLDKGLPFTLQDRDIIQLGTLVHRGHGESYQPVSVVFMKDKAWSRVPDAQSTYEVPLVTDEESDYGTDSEVWYTKPLSSNMTTPENKKDLGSELKPIDVESWTVQPPHKVIHDIEDIEEVHPAKVDAVASSATVILKDDDQSAFDPEDVEQAESLASCDSCNSQDWPSEDFETYNDDNDEELESNDAVDAVDAEAQTLPFDSLAGSQQNDDQPAVTAANTAHEAVNTISNECGELPLFPITTASEMVPRTLLEAHGVFAWPPAQLDNSSARLGHAYPIHRSSLFDRELDSSVGQTTAMQFPPPNLPPRPLVGTTDTWGPPASGTGQNRRQGVRFNSNAPFALSPAANPLRSLADSAKQAESMKNRQSASQMAIPHILINEAANHAVVKDHSAETAQAIPATESRKRKADAVTTEANHEFTAATQTLPIPETTSQKTVKVVLEPRPKKKVKTSQTKKSTFVNDLGKLTLGAALGMTGTFTLLASPLGGMLADWASKL